jgi:hypothetical protein
VRRISAILLLALFSFLLIGPAVFASDPEANLPACCRRRGKHHCTVGTQTSATEVSLQTGACPNFLTIRAVPASVNTGMAEPYVAEFTSLLSHPVSRPQTETLLHIWFSLAGQKRGPPLSRP